MTDLAVRVAYRGDGFSGSQMQPGLRTVESTLLSSIERVTELEADTINLRMASRTDKGVSSTGNVASFETMGADPVPLLKALNSICGGVLCTAYARVDDSFLPRHADMRTYEYVARADRVDTGLVNDCLALFRGRRDFAGFCKAEGRDTVIDLVRADARVEDGVLVMTFEADHFLWNMIRRIVPTALRVGSGRIGIERAEEALNGGWSNFGLAPAEGLTLTDVFYEGLEFAPSPDPALRSRRADGAYRARLDERFYRNLREPVSPGPGARPDRGAGERPWSVGLRRGLSPVCQNHPTH